MVSTQNFLPEVFEHEKFGKIRTFVIDGEIKFVAADVCRALDLSNVTKALYALKDNEKMTLTTSKGHSGKRGGAQMLNVVNEPGLYRLIFLSRKPEAEEMKDWVFHEVLPQIRKYGFYSLGDEELETVMPTVKECDQTLIDYLKLPRGQYQLYPKISNITVEDPSSGVHVVYRFIVRKEYIQVPFIYYPKYNRGNLVFTKKDIMGLLNISAQRFMTAFNHLKDTIQFKLLRGEELKSFIGNNPFSEKVHCLHVFPRDSVYAFFEYFGVEVPEELKKICTVMKHFDSKFVSDFINTAQFLNNQLEHTINKFTNEMIFNGVCKKLDNC